jgi:hypothetical protein
MTEPAFLSIEQIMDLLMDELPDGVYADDRADDPDVDKRSHSSSELRAHAQMLADLYENLSQIDADKFLTTVTEEGLTPWEKMLFQTAQDSSLDFETRKSKLLAKFRSSGSIARPAISDLVASVLDPLGLTFELAAWCGSDGLGGWILDFTELDVGTYLAAMDPLLGAKKDFVALDCSLDYAAAGLTADELAAIQETAYSYEVRIIGHADAETLSLLDLLLTQSEPARSTHRIVNDFVPVDPLAIDMGGFTGSTLTDVIDCGTFTSPPATYDVWDMGDF